MYDFTFHYRVQNYGFELADPFDALEIKASPDGPVLATGTNTGITGDKLNAVNRSKKS